MAMIKFYYAPWSRASTILWLLEELGQPYAIERVDIRAPDGVPESYRAIQPNKKVPAIMHDGTVVTERAAICLYLTEKFPGADLAPAIDDKDRAAFLSWLVYSDSVFDPAVAAKAHGLTYESNDYSFGTFDDMLGHLEKTLSQRPYIAGDKFTAADVQIGSGIHYTMNVLGALPERPVFKTYLERVTARPAFQRSAAMDLAMAKDARMAGAA
jgi:glutathione S-transferase